MSLLDEETNERIKCSSDFYCMLTPDQKSTFKVRFISPSNIYIGQKFYYEINSDKYETMKTEVKNLK